MGRANSKLIDQNPTLGYEVLGFTETGKDVNIPVSRLGLLLSEISSSPLSSFEVVNTTLGKYKSGDTIPEHLTSNERWLDVGVDPIVYGKNKRWSYLGFSGTSPSSDAGVQSLAVGTLLEEGDTAVFSEAIPAGTQEFSFYVVKGSAIDVVDEGNHLSVTRAFQGSDISVSNVDGSLVDYTKNTLYLGLGGFLTDTVFTITIQ